MKKKVLIVDDEADMRVYLESLIAEQGYETATASDGDNGYDLAKSFKPDVITLDVIMERETGIKFYRNLLKDPALMNTPVIIISGVNRYNELFGRDHVTMRKPFAFIEKPPDVALLLSKIDTALNHAKS